MRQPEKKTLDLVNTIIRLAHKDGSLTPLIMLQTKIAGEIDAQYLSGKKAQERLGWKPEVSLDEGLRRTIKWYRSYVNEPGSTHVNSSD